MMRHKFLQLAVMCGVALTLASIGWRALAQSDQSPQKPTVIKAEYVDISKALRDIEPAAPPTSAPDAEARRSVRFNPRVKADEAAAAPETAPTQDGALQITAPSIAMPAPISSFDGGTVTDCNCAPPDTNIAVGPNHVVEMINVRVRIYNKSGTLQGGPIQLSQLWASAGRTDQCATTDDGDPIVVYDQLANRWLLSQFAVGAQPFFECVAISQTADPTGAYYLYSFQVPNNEGPDYPKIGMWPDGYYMTVNQFTNFQVFNGTGAYAFNRAKMLAGDPTAELIYFNLNLPSHPEGIFGMLPAGVDGVVPPPVGAPDPFVYFTALRFGDPMDGLRIFNFHADFAVPANSTFTEFGTTYMSPLPVAAFDPRTPPGRADVAQPGVPTSSYLDAITDVLMFRLQYRNFGDHETLVTNHTVHVGPVPGTTTATFQAGVRWYDLRRTGGDWFVRDQGTFGPNDVSGDLTPQRWMGSAAMDASGNIAVGYSKSSRTVFPTVAYAGRLAGDAAGTLGQGEAILFPGLGSQLNTANRWGDYSSLVLDTDDCTFWYANEYYPVGPRVFNWRTRIGSFSFGLNTCTPRSVGTGTVHVTNCGTGANIAGAAIMFNDVLYGTTDADGNFVATLPPGTYTVSATSAGVTVSGMLTVMAGANSTLNLCITPRTSIALTAASLTVESCPPPNGVVDPAERVTYAVTFQNTGGTPTTNLVATLKSGPNVSSPGAAQSYGALPPGGSATRTFSWTAVGACGSNWTAVLEVADGPNAYANQMITGVYGVLTTVLAENFDGVVAPALPPGWVAVNNVSPDSVLWTTSTASPHTAPNDAFVNDPGNISDKRLDTPVIGLAATGSAQVSFRNNYDLESTFDGGVLEIQIGAGAFADIITAGGSFVSGGYNGTISTTFGSPIGGRQAWTGNSGGYVNTVVNLPAAALGQNIHLRFRMASDNSVQATGWRVDTVSVTQRSCVTTCALIRIETSTVLARIGPDVQATITVRNTGSTTANNVMLTTAMLGSTAGAPLPQALGAIPAGGSATAMVVMPLVGPGPSVLKVGGTYTGGAFNSSARVSVP